MKNLLTSLIFSTTCAAAWVFCTFSTPAAAQVPPAATPAPAIPAVSRSINVTGEASEQFAPDQGILSMSLVSRDNKLTIAKQANDAMVERVVNIVRNFSIPREKIATSNLYITPEYTYNSNPNDDIPDGQSKLNGYVVNRTLRITMDSLDVHEKLLSALVEAKVDQVNGVEFKLSNPESKAMQLRVKAFQNARERAQALAEAAGAKLGQAISISTNSASTPISGPPMPMVARMAAAGAEPSIAPSLPGMVELRETVNATFAME